MSLTLVGLLPLAALTGLSIYTAHRAHRGEVERATLDLARAVATAVEAELSASVWALQALSKSNEVERGDLEALHSELKRFAVARPDVVGISLADPAGTVILRTTQQPQSSAIQPVEPASIAKVLKTGAPVVGSITKGRSGEFAYPVRVPVVLDGQIKFVLTAAMRPHRLREIVERQRRPSDWLISVFDSDLRRVARSREHESTLGGAPAPTLQELLTRSFEAEGVGHTTALEGDSIVTAYASVSEFGWKVAVGAPVSLVRAVSSSTLLLYMAGLGASLLLAVPLALAMSRRVRNDIGMVLERAKLVGSDDWTKSPPARVTEVGRLMEQVEEAHRRVKDALDRADRAAAAKDHFLALLGHELRNPLAPISNVLHILDRKSGEDTARERQILRRQVRHMTRLVDDLLDVSRLIRGESILRREAVDLVPLVEAVLETFRQQEPTAQIRLRVEEMPIVVDADAVRITQVVTNLLINAHRHGAGRPIAVEVVQIPDFAQLRVIDSGEGMDAATLARVFEPFFQAGPSPGSLGIGLAIAKAIIEGHGGYIRATSDGPGKGSAFEIGIPR